MSYHIHKTSLKRENSYIKSSEWLINKRVTINPKNKDDKCFQYSIAVALNHQNIGNHLERISNIDQFIDPFIDQYNSKGIEFPAGKKIGKDLNEIIKQLFLIFCLLHIMKIH